MPTEFCKDHSDCLSRINRLEKNDSVQWKKLDAISTKLNLIIGGIILSPFIVALITLLTLYSKGTPAG